MKNYSNKIQKIKEDARTSLLVNVTVKSEKETYKKIEKKKTLYKNKANNE